MGLDPMNQSIAKNATDGTFMDKTFTRVTQILDKMAQHNQAWHSEDTIGRIAYGSPSLTNMIMENQERDQVIAGLATNVNVLAKMFTKSQTKKVNVVEDVQPISNEDFEEANYVSNSQGGYQRQQYQGSEQEVEVEEPSVIEVEKVPEELRVQEENMEEVKEKMPGFAKYLKDLITKKITTKYEVVNVTHRVSSIIATSTIQKKEDPGAFTIPCTVGTHDFARALCDNGASVNLMPLAIYKQAGLGMPRPTSMRLQMVEHSIKRPVGIVDDVLVKVGKFLLPTDFIILDCVVDK
uniref:Gag-asp_proteas domain-containing protein n=1 Tax=Nicotiana tabacum TaxID=4097 RepID=A0A1S3YNT5_TOBAC|nr:PREDICTED: uncharacterized protein LOC107778216 [Nicotiana tabacum]